MLEERVVVLENKMRELESLGVVRDAIAKFKKEQDEAYEKSQKDFLDKSAEDLKASRRAAVDAAKREGRPVPQYADDHNATPQKNG